MEETLKLILKELKELKEGQQELKKDVSGIKGMILRQENRHRFFYRACAWWPS